MVVAKRFVKLIAEEELAPIGLVMLAPVNVDMPPMLSPLPQVNVKVEALTSDVVAFFQNVAIRQWLLGAAPFCCIDVQDTSGAVMVVAEYEAT